MKIERISDKQIRCTLYSEDLTARSINLMELAYGSNSARKLFNEMLHQASFEVGFDVSDTPIMIEAIPLANNGIVLVITKVDDPEEVDTRFARFTPLGEDGPAFTPDLLEGLEQILRPENAIDANIVNTDETTGSPDETATTAEYRVFSFNCLDEVIDVARVIGTRCTYYNTLYKREDDSMYFLLLEYKDSDSPHIANICNILSEYGKKVSSNYSSNSFYNEHYTIIVKEKALQELSSI